MKKKPKMATEGPTWNEKEEFFRNSPKSIYFHELSKINEIKKKRIRIRPLFPPKIENRIFLGHAVFTESSATICSFILNTFQMRFNGSFWAQFNPLLPQNGEIGFFLENRASSLLSTYGYLTSCKKIRKN